jgi:hypothetical protein
LIDPKDFEVLWKKLMDSPDGERVLDGITTMYMMRSSHVAGDPYETAFREGERSVAMYLLQLALTDNQR